MKLLQWNIWNNEKVKNILVQLKKIDADIVCVQELCVTENDFSNVEILKSFYPYVYFNEADRFKNGVIQGNAILSKYEIIKAKKFYVQKPSDVEGDYSKEGRVYLEADIKIENKILSVGTTHLSYVHKFGETKLKDKEVERLIGQLKKHKQKFLFCGDLNASKDTKYIKQIESFLKSYDTSNTWTTKPFSYNGFEENDLNWKLDYVFSTVDIKVDDVEVLKTKYSDHLPILVKFDF